MSKRRKSFSHADSVALYSRKGPEHHHPKVVHYKKKKWGKVIGVAIGAVVLLVVAYLAVFAYNTANKVFTKDGGILSILNQNPLKETDGITNIALLGKGGANHAGGQLTDTLLLMRVRQSDKKVGLVSIPRDLYVSIPGNGSGKINEAYANGYNSVKEKDNSKKDQAGQDLAAQTIEKVAGVPIHYTVVIDFVGLSKIVDVLGGVTVTVEKNLYDPYYPEDSVNSNGQFTESDAYATVNIKAGTQNMDGETALKYARSRETTSDFDRSHRQQNLIMAIKDKALSLGILTNPVRVADLISTIGDHLKTNMSLSEVKAFADLAKNINKDEINNKVLDNSAQGLLYDSSEGSYHLLPKGGNFSQIQAMIKGMFDAPSTDTPEVITVDVYNGSGESGLAGNLAQQFKNEGIKVSEIATYSQIIQKSIIKNGTGSSRVLNQIKEKLPSAEVTSLDEKGKIVVIIGEDYGK